VDFKPRPGARKKTSVFPRDKTEAVAATAVRLAELGPVLVFAGQARWVPSMAKAVLMALGPAPLEHPWPSAEWRLFVTVCTEELGEDSFELNAARLGVICHSNSLPPQVRIAVEKLIARQPPRVIVATSTLGQGVNIGVSSAIVATTSIGTTTIRKRDFWNICGRAGRAFVDSEGKVLYAIDATQEAWRVRNAEASAKRYFDLAHLDSVESGLLQVVALIRRLAEKASVSFEVLLELIAHNDFGRCGSQKATIETLVDWIDDHLLALHVAYAGDSPSPDVSWVDDAFRDSLAAIQERGRHGATNPPQVLPFLKARATGVLLRVPSATDRRAVIASGLPLSVSIAALNHLDQFRAAVDHYLDDPHGPALNALVLAFETWAREHAKTIIPQMPPAAVLDEIRPLWLSGRALRGIVQTCGDDSIDTCTELYGFQLPWLFHSVAQKLDKTLEEPRFSALAKVGLLVELGLPSEGAARVFLAGVRSRAVSTELGQFVVDPSASVSRIRQSLLSAETTAALSSVISEAAKGWLQLLSNERDTAETAPTRGNRFRLNLDVPAAVDLLHVRELRRGDGFWLCSTDARFKTRVRATDALRDLANDPCFVLSRDGDRWVQTCRDPRRSPVPEGLEDFFF